MAQFFDQLFADLVGAGLAALGGQAAGHGFLGGVIQFAQQRRLPPVPHVGTNGAGIGHGENQQHAQAFRRLHQGDEIAHRHGVVQVTLIGGAVHVQVVQHQPRDGFRLARVEPEPRTQLGGHFGPHDGMVAAPALGDVVQQDRHVQNPARLHVFDDLGRHRMVVGQQPAFDAAENIDGADGVLVHRIDVVHVVLHLRRDAVEIRYEAAHNTGLA